jgi:hypothetical protein
MAPNGSRKEKGKATAMAKMPTSVKNRGLSFNRDRLKGYTSEHFQGLIQIFNILASRMGWHGTSFML